MKRLVIDGFTKSFRGRKVVNEVSLAIEPGEVVGLLGPNGAGKTTTFYMVVGLIPPDRGMVFIGEEEITELSMYRRANLGISYLPQEPSIFRKMTVEENIVAILEFLNLPKEEERARLKDLLDELGLTKLAGTMAYALSGGERRRVELARALVNSPHFMLLDEPFAGIDPIAVGEIQSFITRFKEKGIGVLITDHNVRETLNICDRAYIINDGKIVETGAPSDIIESQMVRDVYLGENFTM
ncbi:MAG: LPS export ABC transporter ATP-binding protein [Thermodesulfobacteriota bacterium]